MSSYQDPYLVSLAGADDTVEPDALWQLSVRFPAVEWAILSSAKRAGTARYPSSGWVHDFSARCPATVHRSIHLCGSDVDDFCNLDDRIVAMASSFQRMQLNFNQLRAPKDLLRMAFAIEVVQRPVIIQLHSGNLNVAKVLARDTNVVVTSLQDGSGGNGASPSAWLAPVVAGYPMGYAGGLGPDNVAAELPRIREAAAGTRFYIDMESKLRSLRPDGVDYFDIEKCAQVLRAVEAAAVRPEDVPPPTRRTRP